MIGMLIKKVETSAWIVGAVASLFCHGMTPVSPGHAEILPGNDLTIIEIAIKARSFQPSPAKLPVGREALMVFRNQDAELHAFVPDKFLDHLPLHVDGNGASQFGERGLVRILIPSGGQAQIRFRPDTPGLYEYRCDLPGHQMVGHILVEDSRFP